MTGWLPIAALALAAFAAGAALLRRQRGVWSLLGAVLVLGLAGYAWQGTPDYASAPAVARADQPADGSGLVEARRAFFAPDTLPGPILITADAFARRGDFARSAGILRGAVQQNPADGEAWLALAIALTEHGRGRPSAASDYALARARARLPGNPGPGFFEGLNTLRSGDFVGTRAAWLRAVEGAGENVPGREYVVARLQGLDDLVRTLAEQQHTPRPAVPDDE